MTLQSPDRSHAPETEPWAELAQDHGTIVTPYRLPSFQEQENLQESCFGILKFK